MKIYDSKLNRIWDSKVNRIWDSKVNQNMGFKSKSKY